MGTSVTFAGVTIQGDLLKRPVGPMAGRVSNAESFGLNGASSITGGVRPQSHIFEMELNSFATEALLFAYTRSTLKGLLNTTGTLVLAGTLEETLTDLQLTQIAMIAYDGQNGPLPNAPGANPWTDHCRLTFNQLG